MMKGSCLCGAIAYEVRALSGPIVHCHCVTCRKAHGAAYASTAGVDRPDFRWLRGEDVLGTFESSPGKLRHFCTRCGSHLMAERPAQSRVILRVATLDEDPGARPASNIWTSHDVPWLANGPGVASYAQTPAAVPSSASTVASPTAQRDAPAADGWFIRPFREEQTDAVIALWHACGLTRPWNDPARDIARKLAMQRDGFLVGTLDDRVVGSAMVGYDGHRGWVNYLGVDPSCQGRGLGRALMARAESWLLEAGCPKINLQVRAGNDAAMAFYRAIGYGQDPTASLSKRLIPDD